MTTPLPDLPNAILEAVRVINDKAVLVGGNPGSPTISARAYLVGIHPSYPYTFSCDINPLPYTVEYISSALYLQLNITVPHTENQQNS